MCWISTGTTLVMMVLQMLHSASPSNLCATSGLCCKQRDSHCVVQRVYANHTVDTSQLPCYCDHACVHLDDCCADYKHFCAVNDCQVSEWGPWSPCSTECGIGFQERHRIVLMESSNGGAKCPHLVQSRQCRGMFCLHQNQPHQQTQGPKRPATLTTEPSTTKTETNTGKIIEAEETAESTEHGLHPILNSSNEMSCMEMVIIRASAGCRHHDYRLHIGTRICVQCAVHEKPFRAKLAADEEFYEEERIPTCLQLTETAIRKFRLHHTCQGKITFLSQQSLVGCKCSSGLYFKLI